MVALLIKSLYLPVINAPVARAAPIGDNLPGCPPTGLHLLPTAVFRLKKSMKIARTLVLLLPLILTTVAQAITVKGSRSCGEWVKAQADGDRVARLAAESWLIGYLSGLAMAYQEDTLKEIDSASIFVWTDNYCKANPLNRLSQSGQTLHEELDKKRAPR